MKKKLKKKPEPEAPLILEATLQEPKWIDILPDYHDLILRLASQTFEKAFGSTLQVPLELSVVLADDAWIQTLNRDHRNKDQATNVLAFPNLENPKELTQKNLDQSFPICLGDIVLALETCKKEADQQEKLFEHHISHLLIHGILHLLGFDHIKAEQAKIMETLEIEILALQEIDNPYKIYEPSQEESREHNS